MDTNTNPRDTIHEIVREGYRRIAEAGGWSPGDPASPPSSETVAAASCCGAGGCCGPAEFTAQSLAERIGYDPNDLNAIPASANLGLSCGNPAALASLQPGEVVVDLGSGGGFDCFIAGRQVGANGHVIGIDMTAEMLQRARKGIADYRRLTGLSNVEFRLGEIEHLPVADASVDVVISNCVLNLSPDKPQVWRDIARILKPGGRVAISDLALVQPLPADVTSMVEALVGCVAGAVLVEEMRAMARAAGMSDIVLTPKPQYVDAMTSWEDPLYRQILDRLPPGSKASDYITSLDVAARKPRTTGSA